MRPTQSFQTQRVPLRTYLFLKFGHRKLLGVAMDPRGVPLTASHTARSDEKGRPGDGTWLFSPLKSVRD